MLNPGQFGSAVMEVIPGNTGPQPPEPPMPIEAVIEVADVNSPPTCSFPDALAIVESAGPLTLPRFLTNLSVGPDNERYQHLVFQIEAALFPAELFAAPPFVTAEGSLMMQTADGRHGSAQLILSCWDSGGVEYGGVNTAGSGPVALRVLPQPKVFSVEPGFSSLSGGGNLTVRGQHFGSEVSRGYWRSEYEHVTVFIGREACERTLFVSDSELLCVGVPPGNGVSAVTVSVSDPFATTQFAPSLERNGSLPDSFVHLLFIAGGPSVLAFGAHYVPPVPPPPPVVPGFENLTAFLESSAESLRPSPEKSNWTLVPNGTIGANGTNGTSPSALSDAPPTSLDPSGRPNVTNSSNGSTALSGDGLAALARDMRVWLRATLCVSNGTNMTGAEVRAAEVRTLCNATLNHTLRLAGLCALSRDLGLLAPLANGTNRSAALLATACGFAPPPVWAPSFPPALDTIDAGVSGVVRALAQLDGRVYAGGGFVGRRVRGARGVMAWRNAADEEGALPEALGGGVDGAVAALAGHRGLLVLGGTFTAAITTDGKRVPSGGLVAWDPAEADWIVVGRTPMHGAPPPPPPPPPFFVLIGHAASFTPY